MDEWVPVQDSTSIWRDAVTDPAQLTICELDGTSHYPTLSARHDLAAISPEYTMRLTSWLDALIPSAQQNGR